MKGLRPRAFSRAAFAAIMVLGAALISSCATAPQYDSTTDSDISNLQKEIDSQLVQWIACARIGNSDAIKKSSYQENVDFYSKVDTDLTALELRIEAVPDKSTAKLPAFFGSLRTQLKNLQDTHEKKHNLPEVVLVPIRNQLNAQFAVLLTYELSLKGVGSPSTATTQSTSTKTAASKADSGK